MNEKRPGESDFRERGGRVVLGGGANPPKKEIPLNQTPIAFD